MTLHDARCSSLGKLHTLSPVFLGCFLQVQDSVAWAHLQQSENESGRYMYAFVRVKIAYKKISRCIYTSAGEKEARGSVQAAVYVVQEANHGSSNTYM